MSVSAVFPSDAPQMVRPLGNAEQYYVKKSLANTWSNLYLFIYFFNTHCYKKIGKITFWNSGRNSFYSNLMKMSEYFNLFDCGLKLSGESRS